MGSPSRRRTLSPGATVVSGTLLLFLSFGRKEVVLMSVGARSTLFAPTWTGGG
jgi:hypothetical protein